MERSDDNTDCFKVSVVIPVFNTEKYIERCTRSLLSQTLDRIEFLFIDDCSTDNSIIIVHNLVQEFSELLKQKESEAIIIRMAENKGQAAVRKIGIDKARGTYLIHCDSDDWIDSNLYEKMYLEAVRSDADVVTCPIRDEFRKKGLTRPISKLPSICNEVLRNWWYKSEGMFCWNKMIRRCIFTDNQLSPFEGINMWEDNGLMLRVFYYAKGLSQIEGSLYHYNQANSGAMTRGYGRDKVDQMIKCASLLGEFFDTKEDGKKYLKTILTLKYLAKLNLVTTRFDWLNEFYHLFPESNKAASWIRLDAFSPKGKIRFLFVKYHFAWLFILMYKVSRKLPF